MFGGSLFGRPAEGRVDVGRPACGRQAERRRGAALAGRRLGPSPRVPYDHHTTAGAAARRHRRHGRDDRAEPLIEWCIAYVEAEARAEYIQDVPPAHYESLADLYLDTDRPAEAVAVLERDVSFVEAVGGTPRPRLVERPDSARSLAGRRRAASAGDQAPVRR
jgi:hypothetical protein